MTDKELKNNIPSCHIEHDEWNGDYDCDYEFSGQISCENCICNYEIGGRLDPRTGKVYGEKEEK